MKPPLALRCEGGSPSFDPGETPALRSHP
jgi:hypothetical protein